MLSAWRWLRVRVICYYLSQFTTTTTYDVNLRENKHLIVFHPLWQSHIVGAVMLLFCSLHFYSIFLLFISKFQSCWTIYGLIGKGRQQTLFHTWIWIMRLEDWGGNWYIYMFVTHNSSILNIKILDAVISSNPESTRWHLFPANVFYQAYSPVIRLEM